MIICICTSEISKTRIKASYLVHNNHLNLCRQEDNSKCILHSPNTKYVFNILPAIPSSDIIVNSGFFRSKIYIFHK